MNWYEINIIIYLQSLEKKIMCVMREEELCTKALHVELY